ncbi:adenylate/guanylate cyclase catalytic domain protein [Oesophagostomum dentatum]|uniref:guanylate cyclase n=1 Tax=Oesophagostomum dentatum TaxID=61180 RepID=A0A0B1TTS0_OESDE|nr:adenylate/guanylate cyclase catalytic domain protein [Oesophagostomum dentatum]
MAGGTGAAVLLNTYCSVLFRGTVYLCMANNLLWTAPEALRNPNDERTPEGDIYSFAIISAQLVTRSSAWNLEHRKEDADEILYMVKKGGTKALRPTLEINEDDNINPAVRCFQNHLIRDCWAENPSDRPPIDMVKSSLHSMFSSNEKNSRKQMMMLCRKNLIDHILSMLESHASILEEEVEARTKELIEEKKKSDLLLYRMLPRQIADRLKLGQSVEPECYDSVTVFFSDVVSFTTIASKGTPLQVVDLLNNLYTLFDSVINEHDVYKVETIGDAYLCVSGLPNRNGNEHIKEISSMSLEFMKSLVGFRIPHLPNEALNLRVGFHTGGASSSGPQVPFH